ncbi:ABC transporter substrate-binding protein [Cryobacterium sp. PAMC25264]|uniref:ABC transporter substrate-binding protein n=1 Tax=Cryobacterium sp. PAMC25264 TaxID=2861288 RepID=UPI001C631298|nr:ABC transporter substrate-binding protein [Cryobacterium sp. PAMC25264]QYF74165.1 ABC transporter substrate-binding protein [Cryobacterium sp. PAMC25264]
MSRTRSTTTALITLGVVSALSLSACASAAPASTATRVDGGTIVYGHQQEPACVFGGWIEQAYLSSQVLDGLVSLDENHQVVPWLADSWSVSDDQLTWTFTLKDGVTFTDGTPLTAAVVAYNFDYWLAGGNSTASVWLAGYYASAQAVDDRTLTVNLSAPYPRLADNLTQGYFGIQSQQALETRTDEENCEAPIGSGAFVVDHWNRGEEIVLVRNEDYTSPPANAKHTGVAYVDQIDWKFVADPTTRAASLSAGETDVIYDVPAVAWKTLESAGFQLEKYITPGRPQQLTFNTSSGPFVDEKVRQAFAYSLDRESLVETIGQGVIPYEGNGGVSQATPGYSQAAADLYNLDTDTADSLLDAAGWTGRDADGYRTKGGETLDVVLPYGAGSIVNADGASILQGLQEQAKATGFKVELIPVPQSALFAGEYSQPDEKDISVGYWTAVTSGILAINWRQGTPEAPNYNNASFTNYPELESIILEANSTLDTDAQNALYEKAQEYIAEHALAIGVYDRLSTLAVSPTLKDVWQENAQGGPIFYDAYFVE